MKRVLKGLLIAALCVVGVLGGARLLANLDGLPEREKFEKECRAEGNFLSTTDGFNCVDAEGRIVRQLDR